jgi:hypothetical protein
VTIDTERVAPALNAMSLDFGVYPRIATASVLADGNRHIASWIFAPVVANGSAHGGDRVHGERWRDASRGDGARFFFDDFRAPCGRAQGTRVWIDQLEKTLHDAARTRAQA